MTDSTIGDPLSPSFETDLENLCGVDLISILKHLEERAHWALVSLDPTRVSEAEDVAQEVIFILLKRELPDRVNYWKAWIARAVRNEVLQRIRARNAQKRPQDRDRVHVEDFSRLPRAEIRDHVVEALEAAWTKQMFLDVVSTLQPADKQEVFLATYEFDDTVEVGYVRQRTCTEVAAMTSFGESKVKHLWAAGRPELRDAIDRYLDKRGTLEELS